MHPQSPAIFAALVLACLSARAQGDCEVPVPATGLPLALAEARFLACSRDLRAANRAIEGAEADRIVAGQRPNPTLTLGVNNLNPAQGVGAGPLRDKTMDSSLRLEQLLERGGKAQLREKQGDALLEASRADRLDALRQGRAQLRTAFFELAWQQERARLLGEFASLADESARASRKRFEAGDVSAAESNRIRLDAVRAHNDFRQAEADRSKARSELGRLLALDRGLSELQVRAEFDALPESPAAPIDARADVFAARWRVEAAQAARDLAATIGTRDVTVGAQVDHWPTSATNMQGTGNSFGVTLSIPLSVRHANEGEVKRAAVDLQASRENLERLASQAATDAAQAQSDWESARERRVRTEGDVLPVAREVARGAEFAYTRGATSVLDLLDARRSLKQAELEVLSARADAAKAWARREAALETVKGQP